MAIQGNKNAEKHEEGIKEGGKPELVKQGKEIEKASREFVEGVSEVVEGAEGAETVAGEVGEKSGEGKKKASEKGIGGAAGTVTPVSGPPTIEIMCIQISTQIKKEIRMLEKEVKLLKKRGNFNAAKLNGVVAKIRELRDILANLAYVSVETLKGWWKKFVEGIII
jgi:hypothetical protein